MLRTQQPPSPHCEACSRMMNSFQDTRGCLELVDSMLTVEFDADRELFQAEYDRDQDSESLAVVALVATVLDKEPGHLAPLYSSIDVDALEELFQGSNNNWRGQDHISFTYEGFEVTVFGDGKIEADPLENT